MIEPDGRNPANRFFVMASCLTSERHGGVLAALHAGATSFDEIAASLPAGTGRERLLMLLRELRDAGFVVLSMTAGPPRRGAYKLTSDGRKMVDLTTFVSTWLSREQDAEISEPSWNSIRIAAARAHVATSPP